MNQEKSSFIIFSSIFSSIQFQGMKPIAEMMMKQNRLIYSIRILNCFGKYHLFRSPIKYFAFQAANLIFNILLH